MRSVGEIISPRKTRHQHLWKRLQDFSPSSGINELKCQQTGQIEGGAACPVRSCDMMTPGLVHLWTFGRQFSAQLAFMMQQPEMLFFWPNSSWNWNRSIFRKKV